MAVTWLLVYRSFFFFKTHKDKEPEGLFCKWTITRKLFFVCVCVCVQWQKEGNQTGWIRFHTTQSYRPDPTSWFSVYKEGQKKKKKERNWDERAAPAYDEASGIRFSFRLFSLFFDKLKKRRRRISNAVGLRAIDPPTEMLKELQGKEKHDNKKIRQKNKRKCHVRQKRKKCVSRWLMGGGGTRKKKSHVMTFPPDFFFLSCFLFHFQRVVCTTRRRNEKTRRDRASSISQGRNEPVVVVVRQQRHHSKRTESILFLEFSTTPSI